ncbi:hypothetical protein Vafri_4275, partial [Volvox africanus]
MIWVAMHPAVQSTLLPKPATTSSDITITLSATPLIRTSGFVEEDIISERADGALLIAADDEDGAVAATAATRGSAVKRPGCLSMSSPSNCSTPGSNEVAAPVWTEFKTLGAGVVEL